MRIAATLVAKTLVSAVCAVVFGASSLSAQAAPPRLKFDAFAGLGATRGGTNRDVPSAATLGVIATTPVRRHANNRLVVGVDMYAQVPLDYGTSCIVAIGPPTTSTPSTGSLCFPRYPTFVAVAPLVGMESGRHQSVGGVRGLIGPVVFRARERTRSTRTLVGLQGRFDLNALQVRRLGLNLWTQGAVTAASGNERFHMVTVGAGLRVQ